MGWHAGDAHNRSLTLPHAELHPASWVPPSPTKASYRCGAPCILAVHVRSLVQQLLGCLDATPAGAGAAGDRHIEGGDTIAELSTVCCSRTAVMNCHRTGLLERNGSTGWH